MSVEFAGKNACIAPEGVFIIGTYDENGVPNAMNAAWGAQSDFDEITLFLAKHKTTENIKHTKAFTVAFATKDTVEIADYFGVETGNKGNKIEKGWLPCPQECPCKCSYHRGIPCDAGV